MTEKRFERYLLDGGFWFDEYVKPVWAINDTVDKNSPITYLEFEDEYKDLCNEVVDLLNGFHEENQRLKKAEILANYRGEMVGFATALLDDLGSQTMREMWEKFKEEKYREWRELE